MCVKISVVIYTPSATNKLNTNTLGQINKSEFVLWAVRQILVNVTLRSDTWIVRRFLHTICNNLSKYEHPFSKMNEGFALEANDKMWIKTLRWSLSNKPSAYVLHYANMVNDKDHVSNELKRRAYTLYMYIVGDILYDY